MPNEDDVGQDNITMADLKNASGEDLDVLLETLQAEKAARARAEDQPGNTVAQEEHARVVAELDAANTRVATVTSELESAKTTARVDEEARAEEDEQAREAASLSERAARKVPLQKRDELCKIVRGLQADATTPEEVETRDAYWEMYRRMSEGAVLAKMFPTAEERLLYIPSADPEIQALHAVWDAYYACAQMLQGQNEPPQWGKAAQMVSSHPDLQVDVRGLSELRKALDSSTAGEGADLIPTAFSATLVEKLQLALQVAGLFVRFTMPSNPYNWPVHTGFATAYRMSQATTDNQFFTSLATPSTPTTTKVQFDADKLAVATFWSDEVSFDSIIPILPFVGDQVVTGLARGLEEAILNGSTLTTDLDNVTGNKLWTSTADARNSWDGIRKQILSSSVTTVDGGTLVVANLRSAAANMGVAGVNPSDLVYIVGPKSLSLFLGISEVLTMEKFGPMATIVSGQLAQVDGKAVVPSEFIKENYAASGLYDGTTTTKTQAVLAHRKSFYLGDRRNVTLEQDRNILAGQNVMVGVWRGDFQCIYDTDKVANQIRNMA